MTGFARSEADTPAGLLACEIRTVNHRHLDLSLRMPEECRVLEPALRERVGAAVSRGKVELALYLRRRPGAAPLVLDEELLDRVVEATHSVARRLGQAAPPDPLTVLRWPGLVGEPEIAVDPLREAALELCDAALAELVAARSREGEHLAAIIREKGEAIASIATAVRSRLPEVNARYRERLVARIAELGATPDPGRLEQELAIVAQRLDVTEELDRLDGHLVELTAVLDRDEPIGRRLDFLLQEFNREANTLGSKSQDQETTRAAVDLKVLVEQIREQVQNIE